VGIPKEKIKILFTPFTKIEENRNCNPEGVGLGLAVSKSIAKALDGDIIVESLEGKGSKFTVNLPLNEDEYREGNDLNELRVNRNTDI